MAPKSKFEKKNPREHVLLRPDTYVGSIELEKSEEFVATITDNEEQPFFISKKLIEFSPGLLRIFVEIISNAIDNVSRSSKTKNKSTRIDVNISRKTGEISVCNDGEVIPIEMNEEEKCYNHTLVFGHLLTSENYDDTKNREESGRNGYGAKLTNIFSKKFIVEGVDPNNKLSFYQEWTNNMENASEPIIKKNSKDKGFTKISWIPDFKRFNLTEYTDDIIDLYTKFVIDAAMLTKIKVYLNGELLPANNLEQYSMLYKEPKCDDEDDEDDVSNDGKKTPVKKDTLYIKDDKVEVLLTISTNREFQHISFVNGIYTKNGGNHVDGWSEALFRPLVDKFNGSNNKKTENKETKNKKTQINIKDIKQFFRIFVNVTVSNPKFDSQEKNLLKAPKIVTNVTEQHLKKINAWQIKSFIESLFQEKDLKKLKELSKSRAVVPGYQRSNKSGTECTLLLTEGLSARTYAIAGIQFGCFDKEGNDWFGVYPLRGKLLNTRRANANKIIKNKEVKDLINILGLKYDTDYIDDKNFKLLKYGQIGILTDADKDGTHITGLILNLFHSLFPTLMKRDKPFIIDMKTPIVKVFQGKKEIVFYDEKNFIDYAKNNNITDFKYYKGLGTIKDDDIIKTFGQKNLYFNSLNKEDDKSLVKVFGKETFNRKTWLGNYDPYDLSSSIDHDTDHDVYWNVEKFIDYEFIEFSNEDNTRSIPNIIDGLKESQRKILFAVKRAKLAFNKKEMKVAQLAAYTAQHTEYKHGEQNIDDIIVKMANEFPGSNNIPILYREGQFGSRYEMGKDAASGRYIYTKMEMLTHLLYNNDDDKLLDYVYENGEYYEPKYYVPILPVILLNGARGIGTGFSTNIPLYNPEEIINSVKLWIKNDHKLYETLNNEDEEDEDEMKISILPEIKPWYRHFKGEIEFIGENKYTVKGVIEYNEKTKKIIITELPIGMATITYIDKLEKFKHEGMIKSFNNYCTPKKIHFIVTPYTDKELYDYNLMNLGLISKISSTNMMAYNQSEKLKKYHSTEEIIDEFCNVRYEFYIKRKKLIISSLEDALKYIANKKRFITEIINEELIIKNKKKSIVEQELEKRKYDKQFKLNKKEDEEDDDDENDIKKGGYEYLLTMHISTFTTEKLQKLDNDLTIAKDKLEKIQNTTEDQMWINDLDEFEINYKKFEKLMHESWNKELKKDKNKVKKTKKIKS